MKKVNKTIELRGVKVKVQYKIETTSNELNNKAQRELYSDEESHLRLMKSDVLLIIEDKEYRGEYCWSIDNRRAKKTLGGQSYYKFGEITAPNEKRLLEMLLN